MGIVPYECVGSTPEDNNMQPTIVKANMADLDLLVQTRIATLRAANGLCAQADMSRVVAESRAYYKAHLGREHIAYLAYDGGEVIANGGISFYGVMPTYHNPTGRKAYIMNMFTHPDYRRRGIARRMLDLLVGEARGRGVLELTLEATEAGRLFYEKYGFTPLETEMILPL